MTDGKGWRLLRRAKSEPAAEDIESTEADLPEAAPSPPAEDRGRALRLAGWIAVVALAGVVAAWTIWAAGAPTLADLREEAGLIGKQELLIGVKDDTPGIAYLNPDTDRYEGFDIEIALMVAAELGFSPRQVRFLSIETEDRGRMQAVDEKGRFWTVDLVVATYSVTAERSGQILMSEPYLETEQTVVTRHDHAPVASLDDLAGEDVCTLATSTSEGQLKAAGVEHVVRRNRISECVEGLRRGDFDAVTTDAAILAGFVAKYPDQLRTHDIGLTTPERWGIATGRNRALRTLVNLALYRSYADPEDQIGRAHV